MDITTDDGRTLRVYDRGEGSRVVMWHHGTPNIGTPPRPLHEAADRLGVRLIGYDRPGYGGSTPRPGRDVASAASDASAVADALGVGSFGVLGHSGGGPHALACAALLPDRVAAAVVISGPAPRHDETWFDGMGAAGAAGLRAAVAGRAAKEAHETRGGERPGPDFTDGDWAALTGEWGWFGEVVEPAVAAGPGPLIDDDLAYVNPWGFDPSGIKSPVLLVHGADDRVIPAAHARDLVHGAELWTVPGEGHISVLPVTAVRALEWLAVRV